MVPVFLGLILVFMAVVIDIGRVMTLKHQLQSAVDAAAIAGASMVKVEFEFGEDNKFDFNKTNIIMVDEKACNEAVYYFNKNMEALELTKKGITILESKGAVNEDRKFEFRVKAEIPVLLVPKLFGTGGKQTVSIFSEAEPSNPVSN